MGEGVSTINTGNRKREPIKQGKELRQYVTKKWREMGDSPQYRQVKRYMGNDPVKYFRNYFSKNSYGYEKNDAEYVRKQLKLAGIEGRTANQFFDEFIRKQYVVSN